MPYTLMIVDDEEVSREGLSRMIDWGSLGFAVAAAYDDGAEAITHLRDRPVDVVLTDIRMIHASGVDLAEWVHEHRPATRVVFISAYSRFDFAKAAIRLGVVHYLVKPLVMGEVDEVFRKIRADLDGERESPSRLAAEASTESGNRPATPSAQVPDAVRRAISYIRSHGAAPISLPDIAEHAAVSPGYLSRLFSESTGETVSACIRRIRVENAKNLLAASNLTVSEVSAAVGYHDVRHFYQVFREIVGMTPTQFRKRTAYAE